MSPIEYINIAILCLAYNKVLNLIEGFKVPYVHVYCRWEYEMTTDFFHFIHL